MLGGRAVPALAGGAMSTAATPLTIPAGTAAGSYYVIAKADADLGVPETQEANNLALAALQVGADLVISSVTAPSTAGAGQSISVSDTTRNAGAAEAAASVTRFYLSLDTAVDASDTLLGSRAVAVLAAGASHTVSTPLTIPAGTPPGPRYVIAQADGEGTLAETLENNNVNFAFVTIGPDLIVSSLTAPSTAGAGTSVMVGDTTRNQGAGPAAASTTKFYLSSNISLDGTDVLLGSRAVPALAGGVTSSSVTSLALPAGTAAGAYFVLAQADADDAVAETTEGNNFAAASILIGPDLIVLSLTAPAAAAAGATLTVNDTTRNIGAGVAAASSTRFYLSTNGSLDGGDTPLGGRAVPSLAGATSSSAATAVTVPAATTAGTYYLIAQADADAVLLETAESNNTASVAIVIGSDLVVSSLTAPAVSGAGATLNVTDTTRNSGGAPAGASSTRLYLSADPALDGTDTLLGARAVPALGAGASSTGTTSLTIPAETPAGTRYILAQADGDGVISETFENNNVNFVAVAIGPDLVVQSVSGPAGAGAGTTLTVNDTTRNQGGGAAASSSTRFYLSANAALDASDVLLGSRAVPALAAAAISSGSTSLTIPPATGPGSYYLIAQADGAAGVAETSEANNTAAAAILIGPDLVISALTAPAVGGAGVTLTVTDTTRNQGGAAGPSTTRIHFSTNAALDAGDTLLSARAVPALAAGATSTGTTSVTIPIGTAPGYYYLIAQADGEGALLETLEINNINYVLVLVGPDLTMQSVSGPVASGPGSTINVSDTTRNQGGGPAGASTTRFYLSVNTVIDATDTLLGSRAVPELAPSTNSSATTSLTIPAGAAPGPYYLIAQADGELGVAETQEANNTALAAIAIGPDLIVPSITAPASAGAGATISVTDTTRNSGGSEAAATVTRIYLSTNTIVDAGDVVLGSRSIATLAPGASSTATSSVTIPAGTPAGWYFVIVKADADATLAETQEINNLNYVWVNVFVP
jgi:subtilase family serine protease